MKEVFLFLLLPSLLSLSSFPFLSILSLHCDIWIQEKLYEQNKRAHCKAGMNGVSLLLLSALTRSLTPSCSGNSSGLIGFFCLLHYSFPYSCPSGGSRNFTLLVLSQAVRSFLRLSTRLPAVGFWPEYREVTLSKPQWVLCSFRPQHSLCTLLAIFPIAFL